jgi:heme/copper-type cytochrome/quinol oxidase subunit 4
MTGIPMNVPKHVLWFEVLLYLSLTLDALSVAFQDRTPSGEMTEQMITIATVMAACLILLLVYFVWLAAQRRKNWPRWALVASLVLSVISLVQIIGDGGLQLDSGIEIISCALTAAGLYFSFTGDAKGWFNG